MKSLALFIALFLASVSDGRTQALLDRHHSMGLTCASCHEEVPPRLTTPDATCIACHGTMVEASRKPFPTGPDPHRSPHLMPGEAPACTECHKVHRPSEVTCVACHRGFQFTFPEER